MPREILRFGDFTLDVRSYEVLRAGRRVRIERRPMDLLLLLIERRPELVSHAEIADRLWGKDVFVDVETGIHGAIRKVRQALRDSPDRPLFVETVPGRGYRFIAPVDVLTGASGIAAAHERANPQAGPGRETAAAAASGDTPAVPHAKDGAVGNVRRFGPAHVWGSALAVVVLAGALHWNGYVAGNRASATTLAVMPSENFSGDPDRDYLAAGLAEEMVVALDKIDQQRVSVISRSSVTKYQRTTKSPGQIGRELGADYLVESSIREESGRLRITAKLIRVRDQVQVWSDSYDHRGPAGILALQRELSAAIANQISLRLSPDGLDALSQRQTRNPEAYDLYLRGQNFANQRTPPTTVKATEYFQRATALDPDYALAWSGLAIAYAASAINSDAAPLDVWPRAREAATEAVRAGRGLAEAQFAQAYVEWMFEWNWPLAETALQRVVAADPRLAMAHQALGHLLSQAGRHTEAEHWLRRAREVDPLYAMPFAISSQVAFQARNYPAALDYARQAIALDPEFWIGHMALGQAYERMGETGPAVEALTAAARFSNGNSKAISLRGYILARTGREQDARDVLKALEGASHHRHVPPYAIALVYAGLGERSSVFHWLERAYAARDVHLMFLTVDPKWDPYRNDPAFVELLTRCGFTWDERSAGNGS